MFAVDKLAYLFLEKDALRRERAAERILFQRPEGFHQPLVPAQRGPFRLLVKPEVGFARVIFRLILAARSGRERLLRSEGANPFLLERVLNDPGLRKTTFVLIHGGPPNAKETRLLLYKPNVYADFSGRTFLLSTRELSEALRSWLEFMPEKVLFGTDAFAIMPEVGWEELGWLTTTSSREALALTGMMHDRQITRAVELARMVMRESAVKLYGLTTK